MGIITTDNLVFEYIRRDENGDAVGVKRAIDGVDLDVEKGQFIAILGHNGSGKSTMAKHINALLSPTGGTVYVCGMDTADEDYLWDIRKSAGMVFQNPDNQIIATVVEDDVAFGPENLGVEPAEIERRVEGSLKAVGMFEHRAESPNHLSGGQKQRVAVAGIMAMKPECIIMDEPTAMLDPNGRKEVLETVHRLNREEGITVLHITHYMSEVTDADRVVVMDHGKVAMQGTPREIFSRLPELQELGLDAPQATILTSELKKRGFPLPEGILSVSEFLEAYRTLPEAYRVQDPYRSIPEHIEESFTALAKDEAPLIELRHVNFTYSPNTAYEKKAVADVSLQIRRGEFVCLIGHTGSGKSTLIQMLNGLEKPVDGQVLFRGEDINDRKYDRRALRSKVGLVFQYPEHQLFEATILKDVCFGPKNQGLSAEEQKKRAEGALRLVGISEDTWNDSPLEISGGQKRRVAIAGVLAMHPEVLILDEPTAGLDPQGRDEILSEISRIHREAGITVVLVSHSMEDVAKYANWVHVMDRGKLLYAGKPAVVFSHVERLKKVGLGVPQVTEIMRGLFPQEKRPAMDFITIEDAVRALCPQDGEKQA
ncbi:MAG: energy-coupling factor transporter ATPase [Lachnospiraceae bacterium]|nr:energy-coupling factor transporter ATPase [Lachnospiraceae bacterium]